MGLQLFLQGIFNQEKNSINLSREFEEPFGMIWMWWPREISEIF